MSEKHSPIIEIHGTGIHNRGAELMAMAISERILSTYANAKIVVPTTFGFPRDIKRYGFYSNSDLELQSKRSIFTYTVTLLTGRMINSEKVDLVIDASGFAFSDQWGEGYAQKLYEKMQKSQRLHQPLIMLPQALGKFENSEVKRWSQKLFDRALIVYARDKKSFEYTEEIILNKNKLLLSPDFTISLSPISKSSIAIPDNFVAIVPNYRMLDKSDSPDEYLNFLRKSVDLLEEKKILPVFVVHDASEDAKVVELLGEDYKKYDIVYDPDPRVLKWFLGKAKFVIGSRFHALVSTLSQGVPCIGAGWSHKYPELFTDFATRESLIDNLANLDALEQQILALSDSVYHQRKSEEILMAAKKLKIKVDEMWNFIMSEINNQLIRE